MCVFFIFNWSIIALQYCVGLCHTSTWISHRYTYVPSLFSLPLACHLILPLEVVTEHGLELSVSDCRFPLAIFLTQRRQWHPTPVLLPGKSHGRRSLVGCSPWGREESDTTERLHFHFSLPCIGEGKWQPTPVFLPGESQGRGHTESDMTEVT